MPDVRKANYVILLKMKSLFKEIQEEHLPSGIKEMMAYALYENKNKLQAVLNYLKKENAKNKSSNIKNSIDHLNYILKEYYHDTKSFKDGQKEHLSN